MKFLAALVSLSLVLLSPSLASAQTDSVIKSEDVRKLLGLLDIDDMMRSSLLDQIELERQGDQKDMPVGFWDEFEKEAMASMPQFMERMIPVYAQNFSHQEIQELTKIYSTPVMQRLMGLNPRLTEEAMKASEAWGAEVATRVALKIERDSVAPASK